MLDGTVEIDETYLGGKFQRRLQRTRQEQQRNCHRYPAAWRRSSFLPRGRCEVRHVGEVHQGKCQRQMLNCLMTDDFGAYPNAMKRAGQAAKKHKTIKHQASVYVDGDIHTNTVESAFSLLKRGIIGTWHKISAKHLAAYLEEMTFRFNRRKSPTLWVDTLRHMITADPLTFENLTAERETRTVLDSAQKLRQRQSEAVCQDFQSAQPCFFLPCFQVGNVRSSDACMSAM